MEGVQQEQRLFFEQQQLALIHANMERLQHDQRLIYEQLSLINAKLDTLLLAHEMQIGQASGSNNKGSSSHFVESDTKTRPPLLLSTDSIGNNNSNGNQSYSSTGSKSGNTNKKQDSDSKQNGQSDEPSGCGSPKTRLLAWMRNSPEERLSPLQLARAVYGSHATGKMINPLLYQLLQKGIVRLHNRNARGEPVSPEWSLQ
jgi:hypothetical protein